MTRIIQQHPTLAARFRSRLVLAVLVALLLAASIADAALTTSACLVSKRKAWGNFRKCQVTEQVKQIKGKPADLAKCDTALQDALTKITARATKAAIPCRYRDNGDGTVTDFDTGLQWEKKDGADGVPALGNPHDVDNKYVWSLPNDILRTGTAFTDFLARLDDSESSNAVTDGLCFVGHCDWRLPTVIELQTILLAPYPNCSANPCIDPIFGPTAASNHWSVTTFTTFPDSAWDVFFNDGFVSSGGLKVNVYAVRAVRGGL